jgi:hypothetical protein
MGIAGDAASQCGWKGGTVVPPEHDALEYGAAEIYDAFEDILGTLADYDLVAIHEGDEGIRSLLDKLDEIGINHQGMIIKAGELDHGLAPDVEQLDTLLNKASSKKIGRKAESRERGAERRRVT